MKRNRGSIALILTALIWGSSFVVTKALLEEAGPMSVSVLRFLVAWVLLVPFAWQHGYRLSFTLQPMLLLFGLTGIAIYFGMFNLGLVFTSASSAALIQAGIPAITTLLSVFLLKERVSRLQWLGIALSVMGLLLITGLSTNREGTAPVLGNLLVVGSVLAWAVYTVQGKKLVSSASWVVITMASIGAGLLCLLPFAIGELWLQGPPHLHADGLLQLLYLGGFCSALGYSLWNYGLRFLDASQAAPYVNLQPVVGLLLGVLILHEPFGIVQIGGGALTLFGVLLSNKGQRSSADSKHQNADIKS